MERPGSGREYRVLVLDDQAPVRRLISLWLRRRGFTVVEAGHAAEASAHLRSRQQPIDLAIIDVVGTSGLDLTAEMSRDQRAIPVLYISGYADSLAVQAIGGRTPEAILLKPLKQRELIDRVLHLLGCEAPTP